MLISSQALAQLPVDSTIFDDIPTIKVPNVKASLIPAPNISPSIVEELRDDDVYYATVVNTRPVAAELEDLRYSMFYLLS